MKKPNFELLKDAYAIIGGIPEKQFNLSTIMTGRGSCGAIGCAVGWLGLHPQFAPMLNMTGMTCDHNWAVNGKRFDNYADAAAEVFSITERDARNLFSPSGHSAYDNNREGLTHRELCLRRIQKFLHANGQWRGLQKETAPC